MAQELRLVLLFRWEVLIYQLPVSWPEKNIFISFEETLKHWISIIEGIMQSTLSNNLERPCRTNKFILPSHRETFWLKNLAKINRSVLWVNSRNYLIVLMIMIGPWMNSTHFSSNDFKWFRLAPIQICLVTAPIYS